MTPLVCGIMGSNIEALDNVIVYISPYTCTEDYGWELPKVPSVLEFEDLGVIWAFVIQKASQKKVGSF